MCKYCGTKNYRRIYENHHGPIGKDLSGRTLEVHHIDGNHSNNHYDNLTLVTIQDHYNIHYSQEDWSACLAMAWRLSLTSTEISELSRKTQRRLVKAGTHHLCKTGSDHPSYDSAIYCFEHIKTNEIIHIVRQDFERAYNLNGGHLSSVITGRKRSIKGWRLLSKNLKGETVRSDDTNLHRDDKIYRFYNEKTQEIAEMTRYEFCKRYNLVNKNINSLVRGDCRLSQGWVLLSASTSNI